MSGRRNAPLPKWTVPAAALGLLLALPSLWLGFVLDDSILLAQIESPGPASHPVNLYRSFDDGMTLPWWTDPDWRISFFRPLSSLVIRLDHALFGRWAPGYQLHALLWLLAVILAAGLLYRRLPHPIASLALLAYAIDDAHTMTSGVICNQHALLTVLPAVLGLIAHLRWREAGWRAGLPLSLAAFALALGAGETAISAMAYVAAYELFAARGQLHRRLAALAPLGLLAALYLVAHRALDFGATGSDYYLDPTGQPLTFLTSAAGRLPALFGGAVAGFPAGLWALPSMRPWQIGLGLATAAALALWLRARWSELAEPVRRDLRWWLPGALGSMLPLVAVPPAERQLLVPMLGFAVLLATLAADLVESWRGGRRWLAGGVLTALALMHLGVAPASRLATLASIRGLDRALRDVAGQVEAASTRDGGAPPSHRVLVNAPNAFATLYLPPMLRYQGTPNPFAWSVLTAAPLDHLLHRPDARTLVLEAVGGEMLTDPFERVVRPVASRLRPGDRLPTAAFEVEILATGDAGPTRVAFHFPSPLEDLDVAFLTWDGAIRPFQLPAVGETVRLPHVPGASMLL